MSTFIYWQASLPIAEDPPIITSLQEAVILFKAINRRQTEYNQACLDCRGAKEEDNRSTKKNNRIAILRSVGYALQPLIQMAVYIRFIANSQLQVVFAPRLEGCNRA